MLFPWFLHTPASSRAPLLSCRCSAAPLCMAPVCVRVSLTDPISDNVRSFLSYPGRLVEHDHEFIPSYLFSTKCSCTAGTVTLAATACCFTFSLFPSPTLAARELLRCHFVHMPREFHECFVCPYSKPAVGRRLLCRHTAIPCSVLLCASTWPHRYGYL